MYNKRVSAMSWAARIRRLPTLLVAVALVLLFALVFGFIVRARVSGAVRIGSLAASSPSCPRVTYADVVSGKDSPAVVLAVPRVIPCQGILIGPATSPRENVTAVLLPASAAAAGILTPAQALAQVHTKFGTPTNTSTYLVLANFTAPGSIPVDPNETVPGSTSPITWHPIEDRLAWVIVTPYAQPVNVGQGHAPAYATAMVDVVDAHDASFERGFFTDAPTNQNP